MKHYKAYALTGMRFFIVWSKECNICTQLFEAFNMGKAFVDRTGVRYGKLTVLTYLGVPKNKTKAVWKCLCDCGTTTTVTGSNLATGHTNSCGCAKTAELEGRRIYAKENSAEYGVWRSVKQRTSSSSGKNHKWYSEVSMCSSWQESFDTFLLDMGKRPSSNHSIERLDPKEGYCAANCIWATSKEQANNRSTNVVLPHDGEVLTVSAWATKTNMKQTTLAARIRRGWPIKEAISLPLHSRINHVSE